MRGLVMQFFIMRHGEAQHQGLSDAERELTEYGVSEVLDISQLINDVAFDLVIVSPYVRAQQTADLIIQKLNLTLTSQACDLVTPTGSAEQVHDYLDGLLAEKAYQNILIVSHMPLISYLLAELTIGGYMPIFQTGAIAKVDYHSGAMKGEFIEMLCPFNVCDI